MAKFSMCKGKRTSNPNKCIKIKSCKVTKNGKRKSYCRKKHNKKTVKKTNRKTKRRTEVSRLKGYTKKQQRALNNLK
jgi:hypothetical protein